MRALRNLLLAAALFLAACAAPLSQQIANGYQQADQYLTRTERLYDAQAIDKETAQKRLNQIKAAKQGLDAASVAFVNCLANGDPKCDTAAEKAGAAGQILNEIEAYLIGR